MSKKQSPISKIVGFGIVQGPLIVIQDIVQGPLIGILFIWLGRGSIITNTQLLTISYPRVYSL